MWITNAVCTEITIYFLKITVTMQDVDEVKIQ